MVPCFFSSSTIDLLQVVFGLPVFLCPCEFRCKACLVTLLVCFRRVCPIHVHFFGNLFPHAVLVCPPHAVLVCPPHAVLVCPPHAVLVCPPHAVLVCPPYVVLVCPPPNVFVCGFILPFGFPDVSQIFVNKCL